MKKIIITTIFIGAFFLGSCEYNSTDDLTETIPVGETISYTNNIKPVIQSSCISCHGQTPAGGAPMSLTSYNLVRDAVENRGLIDLISQPDGHDALMPQGGPRLPQTTINLFIAWQQNGFVE